MSYNRNVLVKQLKVGIKNFICVLVHLYVLKDLGTFCNTKHDVHRFTLNLHRLKLMIVESVP